MHLLISTHTEPVPGLGGKWDLISVFSEIGAVPTNRTVGRDGVEESTGDEQTAEGVSKFSKRGRYQSTFIKINVRIGPPPDHPQLQHLCHCTGRCTSTVDMYSIPPYQGRSPIDHKEVFMSTESSIFNCISLPRVGATFLGDEPAYRGMLMRI